jgi:hypothetical protein
MQTPHTAQIDRHHAVEVLPCGFGRFGNDILNAGIVVSGIESAEGCDRRLDHGRSPSFIGRKRTRCVERRRNILFCLLPKRAGRRDQQRQYGENARGPHDDLELGCAVHFSSACGRRRLGRPGQRLKNEAY